MVEMMEFGQTKERADWNRVESVFYIVYIFYVFENGHFGRIEYGCFGFDHVLMAIKEGEDSLGRRHEFGTTNGCSVLRQGVVMPCPLRALV